MLKRGLPWCVLHKVLAIWYLFIYMYSRCGRRAVRSPHLVRRASPRPPAACCVRPAGGPWAAGRQPQRPAKSRRTLRNAGRPSSGAPCFLGPPQSHPPASPVFSPKRGPPLPFISLPSFQRWGHGDRAGVGRVAAGRSTRAGGEIQALASFILPEGVWAVPLSASQ